MFGWIRVVLHLLISYMYLYWKKHQIVTISTTHKHRNLSWLTRTIRGDSQGCFHSPSFTNIEDIICSCEPWPWLTDRWPYLLLCTVFITAIPLSATYLLTHRGEIECEVTGILQQLSPPSRRIEDSRLHNAQWKNYKVGTMSRRHYSRKKWNWVELVYLVGCSSFIPWIRVH